MPIRPKWFRWAFYCLVNFRTLWYNKSVRKVYGGKSYGKVCNIESGQFKGTPSGR